MRLLLVEGVRRVTGPLSAAEAVLLAHRLASSEEIDSVHVSSLPAREVEEGGGCDCPVGALRGTSWVAKLVLL